MTEPTGPSARLADLIAGIRVLRTCEAAWFTADVLAGNRALPGRGPILDPAPPRVPDKEPTVYHITQVRKVLAACSPEVPTEDLMVRLLVGSGIRRAEVFGLAIAATDGLPDLRVDSMQRGRVELRVRWDAGAKGRKSRRVPITPTLAAALKRRETRHRADTEYPHLLISEHGRPYNVAGIDSMMRVGFPDREVETRAP